MSLKRLILTVVLDGSHNELKREEGEIMEFIQNSLKQTTIDFKRSYSTYEAMAMVMDKNKNILKDPQGRVKTFKRTDAIRIAEKIQGFVQGI